MGQITEKPKGNEMTRQQMLKAMRAMAERKNQDPEIRHAEMIVDIVGQCCRTNTLPNDKVKAEFQRLRKLGYIGSDDKMFWVNYQAAKNN